MGTRADVCAALRASTFIYVRLHMCPDMCLDMRLDMCLDIHTDEIVRLGERGVCRHVCKTCAPTYV